MEVLRQLGPSGIGGRLVSVRVVALATALWLRWHNDAGQRIAIRLLAAVALAPQL